MDLVVAGMVFGLVVGWVAGRSSLRVTGSRNKYRTEKAGLVVLKNTATQMIIRATRNYIIISVLLAGVLLAWLGPR